MESLQKKLASIIPAAPSLDESDVGDVFLILRKDGRFIECYDSIESAELSYNHKSKKWLHKENWQSYYSYIADRVKDLSNAEIEELIIYAEADGDAWPEIIKKCLNKNSDKPEDPARLRILEIINKIRDLNFVEFLEQKRNIENQLVICRVPIKRIVKTD